MTSYDEVWETFLSKCKTEDINIPTTNDGIYQSINNAVKSFNNRLREDLSGDDTTEELNKDLDDDYLLILAHYIRLDVLENQLIYFSTTWNPFTKELGTKNVGNQMSRLENMVKNEERKIEGMILHMEDDFL